MANVLIVVTTLVFLAMFGVLSYFSWFHVYDRTTTVIVVGDATDDGAEISLVNEGGASFPCRLAAPDYTCSFSIQPGYYSVFLKRRGQREPQQITAGMTHLHAMATYRFALHEPSSSPATQPGDGTR